MPDFFADFFCPIFCPIYFNVRIFFLIFLSDIFECPIYCSIFFRFFLIYLNVRSICPIYFSIFFRFFLIYLNVRYYLSDIFVHLCCTCKVAILLIRPIVFVFSPSSLRSPLLSSTQFYILFEQTINIIESFAFSPG